MAVFYDINNTQEEEEQDEYSFEAARNDPELLRAVKDYAGKVENKVFLDDDEAFDWFVGDRRWKDSNTVSMLKEWNRVKGGVGTQNINEQDLANLAVIRERWDRMPTAFERIADGDISGGLGAITENVVKGLMDPTIVAGGLVGRGAGAMATRLAAGHLTKGAVKAVQFGSAVATEGAIASGFEYGIQDVEKDLGLRDEISKGQIAVAGGLGALLSAPGYAGAKYGSPKRPENTPEQIMKALEETKKGVPKLEALGVGASEKVRDTLEMPDGTRLKVRGAKRANMPTSKFNVFTDPVDDVAPKLKPENVPQDSVEIFNKNWPEAKLFDIDIDSFLDNTKNRRKQALDDLAADPDKPITYNPQDYDEVVVNMSVDDFIRLSNDIDFDLPDNRARVDNIRRIITENKRKLDELPEIGIAGVKGADGVFSVNFHEGRHRAQALKELGFTNMPVRVFGADFSGGVRPVALLPQQSAGDPLFRVDFEQYAEDIWHFQALKENMPLLRKPLQDDTSDVLPIDQLPNGIEQAIKKAFADVTPMGKVDKSVLDRLDQVIKRKIAGVDNDEGLVDLVQDITNEFREDFLKATKGKVSAAEQTSAAQKVTRENNAEDVLDALSQEGAINSVQKRAMDLLEGKFVTDLMNARKRILKGDLTTPQAKQDAERAFRRSFQLLSRTMVMKQAFASEAGRTLASFGSGQITKATPQTAFAKISRQITKKANKAVGGESAWELDPDVTAALVDAIGSLDLKNPLELETFMMNLSNRGATTMDMVKEAWYNGILSGIDTAAINASGSIMTTIANVAETQLANVATGRGLNTALLKGYVSALPQAWQVFKKTFRTELPSDPLTRMENVRGLSVPSFIWDWDASKVRKAGLGEGGIGGRQLRLPGRFLMAFDDAMKTLNKQAILTDFYDREAARIMKERGETWTQEQLTTFIQSSIRNPSKEAAEFASETARTLTFTNKEGKVAAGIKGLAEDIPMGWLFVPFVRTPANIIAYTMEPLASGAGRVLGFGPYGRTAQDIAAGGFRKRQAEARMLLSWSIVTAGAIGAYTGVINAAGPKERGERAVWETENLPWSIQAGGTQYQFNRADPAAIPLALGAAITETLNTVNDEERQNATYITFMSLMSEALLEKTWFQGVENVVNLLTQPDRYANTVTGGLVRSVVPSIVGDLSRAMDPRTTAPMTYLEILQDRVGFDAREKIPSRMDVFGREIPVEYLGGTGEGVGAFFGRMVSPFRAKTMQNDPIAKELIDLGVSITPPSKKWRGVELSSHQYYVYSKAKGRYLHDSLKYYMESGYWETAPDAWKRKKVDEIKAKAAEVAGVMLAGTYPELDNLTRRSDVNPTKRRRTKQRVSERESKGLLDFER